MLVAQKKIYAFRLLSLAAFAAFCACAFAQTEDIPPNRQPVEITQGQPAQPAPDNAKPSPAVPAPSQPGATDAGAAPAAAPSLLDQPPEPAKVELNAGKLTVQAANSSLSDILRQISKTSGMKIEGLQGGKDQRVFGIYGPGEPRDVLSDLLDGSGYNVMMLGQMPSGVPRQLALTSRTVPGAAPNPQQPQDQTDNSQDDSQDDVQPTQYPDDQQNNFAQPPQGPPEMRNGLRTPQQILQELQRMHQQQQQEQQEQQDQDQQNQQPDDQPQN